MEELGQLEFDIKATKLIVGLGNIGKDYEKTRHNVGFMFLDFLAKEKFPENKKLRCFLANATIGDQKIHLAKPTTFMNNSGLCVSLLQNYFHISSSEILVVFDDLDITLGNFKLQFQKGPKVHNGLTSVENTLKTSKFWRLRIGVENRKAEEREFIQGMDYVLGKFATSEKDLLTSTFRQIQTKYLS